MFFRIALTLFLLLETVNCNELGKRNIRCWRVWCPALRCANVLPPPPGQCCSTCGPMQCYDKTTGRRYNIGQKVPRSDPCASCYCTRSGRIDCAYRDCAFLSCPDGANPIREKDQCCPTCAPHKDMCFDKLTNSYYEPGQNIPRPNEPCNICSCGRDLRIHCAIRDCAYPTCDGGVEPIVLPGECCPTCPTIKDHCFDKITNSYYKPGQHVPRPKEPCNVCFCGKDLEIHCAIRKCAYPTCEGGVEPVVLPGKCCPTCPDCVKKACKIPVCPFNRIPTVKPGDCCSTCPDCRTVKCGLPRCPVGIRPVIKPGECCHSCPEKPNCSAVSCLKPVCSPGVKPIVRDGQCCPTCPPVDCSKIRCQNVVCRKGFAPVTKPGSCCPICQQDCSNVFCIQIAICPNGKPPVKLPGQCCPTCLPDCRLVRCAAPVCLGGAVPFTPLGQCCPVCPPHQLARSKE